MNLKDFKTLKKLMDRTTSDSDPEALTSLRMANAMLAKENLSWTHVLDKVVTIVQAFDEEPEDADPTIRRDIEGEKIIGAFETLGSDETLSDSFAQLIDSFRQQWTVRRSLSDKQKDILFKAAQQSEDHR